MISGLRGTPAPPLAPLADGNGAGAGMRFTVDTWDPSYGTNTEIEDFLAESTARVDANVELPAGQWRAIDPNPATPVPDALLFVDGVRRIEARVWIDDDAPGGGPASEVIGLAGLSQVCLGRFASAEYKDTRAPQNLYPIGGLERELRRRLGDPRLLYRALRLTAQAARAERSGRG